VRTGTFGFGQRFPHLGLGINGNDIATLAQTTIGTRLSHGGFEEEWLAKKKVVLWGGGGNGGGAVAVTRRRGSNSSGVVQC